MITKRVELPATAASARREREGKPQAAQQENTKQGAGYGNVLPRGCDIKSTGGERASLGQQQRSRSRCKVRKVHLVRALVASMGSESLPALERPTVAEYCGVVGTGCGARRPLRGVKATVTQVLPREDRSSGTGQDALAAQRFLLAPPTMAKAICIVLVLGHTPKPTSKMLKLTPSCGRSFRRMILRCGGCCREPWVHYPKSTDEKARAVKEAKTTRH